jgi:hypothetical protein
MLIEDFVEHVGIIQVPNHVWTKYWVPEEMIIHEPLKTGRGIHETEGHDIELKQALVCHKHCFPFVSFSHMDLIVTGFEVKWAPLTWSISWSMWGRGYKSLMVQLFSH